MEALAALGLAANIAQFIGMAGKAVAKTSELASSRETLLQENKELELISSDFKNLLPLLREECGLRKDSKWHVKKASGDATRERLKEMAMATDKICIEIKSRLDAIESLREKNKPLKSFHATWKEMRLKEVFEILNARLANLRNQISLHINVLLIQQQASIGSALVDFTKAAQDYNQFKSHAIIHAPRSDKGDNSSQVEWHSGFDEFFKFGKTLRNDEPHYEASRRTHKILDSLCFSQIEERREIIPVAHAKTYDWIFDSRVTTFSEWLEHSNASIFWIAGKAGSGKSTLMKHIHVHSKTLEGINKWAGTHQVLIASHFFWAAGTLMQKSQEGLLRTLTYQILTQFPGLAHRVFPDRWKAALRSVEALHQELWTASQLLVGLTSLLVLIKDCFVVLFVDGLDEYSGELDNLIEMLDTLGKFTNVKLCVSSRPWLEFSDAFCDSPWKLYQQDLTRNDIERFTQDTLEANSRFRLFKARNMQASQELVSCITDRAEGVFLWVHLVTRSLIRGIVNADNIVDLQQRLDDLPRGLEPFFERMLETIDEFYKKRTAKVLLVLAHARVPLPLVTFYFLDTQDGLPFDPQGLLKNWPYVDEKEAEAVENKKRQLIAQFKDFISLHDHPTKGALFGFSVGFIHRTAIEFISRDQTRERLCEMSGSAFDPIAALFEVSIEQFKIFSHFWKFTYVHKYLRNWFLSAIYYAREIEVRRDKSVTKQLNQLQDILSGNRNHMPFKKAPQFAADWWHGSLESLAIEAGLWLYAKDMVDSVSAEAALEPILCIELQSDFVVRRVTDEERKKRRLLDSERPLYSSTLQMITSAEVQHASRKHERRDGPTSLIEPVGSDPSDHGVRVTEDRPQKPMTDSTMVASKPPGGDEARVSRFRRFRTLLKISKGV
ncbi:hypothetical protein BJ166DRAFT_586578 [Pestalotiopsis sp. NC0098]|nr:hypothetical protein BJ166DRAFT_586578 [Pestalotiopsis sp. NC0098]